MASPKLAADLTEMLERHGLRVAVNSVAVNSGAVEPAAVDSYADSGLNSTTCDVAVLESASLSSARDRISKLRAGPGSGPALLAITDEPPAEPDELHASWHDPYAAWGAWSDESLVSAIFRLLFQSWRRREYRLLDQIPMPAYLWRREADDDRLIGYNEHAVAITGGAVEKFVGSLASEMYEDRPQLIQPFETCRQTGEAVVEEFDYEYRVLDCTRPLRVHYVPIPPNDILVFTEDLTEIRQAKEELQERETLYRSVFDIAGEGIALMDSTSRYQAVNPKGCEILGYRAEDLEDLRPADLVDPVDEVDSVNANFAALEVGTPIRTRRMARRADGSRVLMDINTARRPDGGYVAFFRDVTSEERDRADLLKKSAALDSSITGLAMASLEGPMDYVNPAFVEMLGAESPDEILGKLPSDFAPEADEVIATLGEVGEWSGELDLQRVDGSWLVAEVNASLVRDEDGEVQAILGSFLDVTERRRVEEELRQSKERLEEAERIAGLGNWYWLPETGQVYWSDQVYRIFGLEPGEFAATYEGFLETIHPSDREKAKAAVERALETGEPYVIEHRIRHPDGMYRRVEERGEAVLSAEGQALGLRGTVFDITERKRAEERREKLQRLYSTLSSVTQVVVRAGTENDVLRQACGTTVRESGLAAAGVILSSAANGPDGELILSLADGLAADDEVGRRWLRRLREAGLDEIVGDDGSRVCNDAEEQRSLGRFVAESLLALGGHSMAVFRLRRGEEPAGFFCVAAARKQFFGEEEVQLLRRLVDHLELALETRHRERQREEAESRQKELQESLRRSETLAAMGRLVSGVAHEVRNPLFGLSASLDAFATEFGERPEMEPYLRVFRNQISRLSVLMEDLLDLGRPGDLERKAWPVREVVAGALEQCSSLLEPFEVRVENRLPDDHEVRVDRDRFQQVLVNLLENAAQHSKRDGKIVLRVDTREGDAGRSGISFRVTDSGSGFPDEDLDRVFEPFFSRRRGGHGLGLSIVDRIVRDHGGTLEAANRRPSGDAEGRPLGAAIDVWLPAVPPESVPR